MKLARRGFMSLFAAALAVLVVSAPAFAQEGDDEYVMEEGEAQCPDTVTQGAETTCTAEGFEPGSEVQVEVLSEAFTVTGTVTANEQGVASFTFEVPCTAMQGQEGTITFRGVTSEGNTLESTSEFTIGGEVAACPEGLPTTGAMVTNGLLIALAVLALGGGLIFLVRRRTDEHVEQN